MTMSKEQILKFVVGFCNNQESSEVEFKDCVLSFFQACHGQETAYKSEIGAMRKVNDNWYERNISELVVSVTYFDVKQNSDLDRHILEICKKWCLMKCKIAHWLMPVTNERFYFEETRIDPMIRASQFAFGTLPEPGQFVQHYHYEEKRNKSELMCAFNHSKKTFSVYFNPLHTDLCKENTSIFVFIGKYESIDQIVVDYSKENSSDLLFRLKHPPSIYSHCRVNEVSMENTGSVPTIAEIQYNPEKFLRVLGFGCGCSKSACSLKYIGRSPIMKLVLLDKYRVRHVIYRLSERCNKDVKISYTNIQSRKVSCSPLLKNFVDSFPFGKLKPKPENAFSCQYAWKSLFCCSLALRDHIFILEQEKCNIISFLSEKLEQYALKNISALIQTLFEISVHLSSCTIINFVDALSEVFEMFQTHGTGTKLPPGVCLVKRVVCTPSRLIYLPPSEHFDNRVIRQFSPEYMLRISVQDDNFSKLTYGIQHHPKPDEFLEATVGSLLRSGIWVSNRKYELLACSNSQLREHGLWLYAKDCEGNTAADIRSWLGDFSKIRSVAKYMSRMGQCFSSTEEGAQLSVSGKNEMKMKDVIKHSYTFTDGIGVISSTLADEVRVTLRKNHKSIGDYESSAFQIRYKGCKGMLVEYPLLNGRVLGIRPSMEKFKCYYSNQLEIVKRSAPRKLFLNRQLITILEQMKVKSEVFMNLQKKMISSIVNSLIYEENAAHALTYYLPSCFPYTSLQKAGISLIKEPFFRSLLLLVFKSSVDLLRSKGRICVPPEYGRNMLGVIDETQTLKYGQVFVQYSKSTESTSSELIVLEGTVLVTKNPCMHPGDVRKLEAVDVPALRYIKDCVVFPAQGRRPHPDEMAGSDLDGDEFVVIWLKELIFQRNNYPPMNYPPHQDSIHQGKISVNDMVDFFCQYIRNDNIGTFANAHLAWADQHRKGIFSSVCMSIARKYPLVLDFAKTGTTMRLDQREKPHQYPDFMEKKSLSNTYYSVKALGMLYRMTRNLKSPVDHIVPIPVATEVDTSLLYQGWEKYKQSAEQCMLAYTEEVQKVLDRFGAQSMTEALCGCVLGQPYDQGRNEKTNIQSLIKTYVVHVMQKYRSRFLLEVDQECNNNAYSFEEKRKCTYQRASSWYAVAYQSGEPKYLSFPWVLSDILSEMRIEVVKLDGRCIADVNHFSIGNMLEDALEDFGEASGNSCSSTCRCVIIMRNALKNWLLKVNLVNSVDSDKGCTRCLDRICDYYFRNADHSCCSTDQNGCTCSRSCSALRLIIYVLTFYMNNMDFKLGTCTGDCNGFWDTNLQSLALQTLVNLAVTRDGKYLGVASDDAVYEYDSCFANSEGELIRILVKAGDQDFLGSYLEEVRDYLKKYSGVRKICIEAEQDLKENWFLLISCVGRNFQRWCLEDLVLDRNFIQKMKKQLKKS